MYQKSSLSKIVGHNGTGQCWVVEIVKTRYNPPFYVYTGTETPILVLTIRGVRPHLPD